MTRRTFSITGILLMGCIAAILFKFLGAPFWLGALACFSGGWMAGFILPIFYDKYLTKDKEQ